MYNVNIPFYSESSSTRWRQILPRRIATRASCSSELLYRSLSDPKRLLMSRRSESDKLLRPRITVRANIFPENAGRSLCSRVSSPTPASSFFTVFSYASRRWWNWNGRRAKGSDGCAANLFAHFYLRGICDRVNHRVNRIRSYPIPKEAYGIVIDCLSISLSQSTVYSHPRAKAWLCLRNTRACKFDLAWCPSWGDILIYHNISRKKKRKNREKSLGFIFEISAMNFLLFLTLRNIVFKKLYHYFI